MRFAPNPATNLRYIAPVALAVLGTALACTLAWIQARENRIVASEHLTAQADAVADQLLGRISSYEYGLRGARGSVISAGDERLTRQIFGEYSDSREIAREFPGAHGFGFIRRVAREHADEWVAAVQRDGWPKFTITQLEPHAGERFVIQYIEPIERNVEAIGLDIASESNRREAALSAARTGESTLTAPITLVQAKGLPQRGFLFLLPVYRPGVDLSTADERVAATIGWAYAPLIVDEMLDSFDHTKDELALSIDDVTDSAKPERFFARDLNAVSTDQPLMTSLTRSAFGRTWRIDVHAMPAFYAALNLERPRRVFIFWMVRAVLFATLLYLYLSVRSRKQQAVSEQGRLAKLVANSSDAIVAVTLDGDVTDWNQAAERMFGYPPSVAIGRSVLDLIVPPASREVERSVLKRIAAGETVPPYTSRRRKDDGSEIDATVIASPFCSAAGQVVGAALTLRDVTQLKATEAALHQVQERLTIATHANGIGVWEWDALKRELTFDDTLYALYGRRREEFPNALEMWRASLHPDDVAFSQFTFDDTINTGRSLDATFRIITPDGHVRHIRTKAATFADATGRVVRVLGTNYDCTAEKERERQLDQLNETLEHQVAARTAELNEVSALQRAILADAAYAVIATDLNGTITLFNPAAEKLLGYRAEELVGKATPAIIHDAAEIELRAAALRAELDIQLAPSFEVFVAKAKHGGTDTNEWTYIRKDGLRVPVLLSVSSLRDSRGTVFGYLGMVVDLTERRRTEQALRDSERFLKAIANNIPGMVSYWDRDLRCRFANDLHIVGVGLTAEASLGVHMRRMVGPKFFESAQPHIEAAFRGEAHTFDGPFQWADGRTRYCLVHYIPDFEGTKVRGFYVVVSDVSELKQAQLDLQKLNADLQIRTQEAEAANLAKSEFLANTSHEIRTPLNAIVGLAYLLGETAVNEEQRKSFAKIQIAARELLAVLNDVLDLSKIEAREMEIETVTFDLHEVLAGFKQLFGPQADAKGLQLIMTTQFQDVPNVLNGDVTRLRQILSNLISNALKFTHEGYVDVNVRAVARDAESVKLRFVVRDSGIGIAEDILPKLFAPFTQADTSTTRRFGGTGLGLSIVRRLAELMGGAVGVTSSVDVGSEFWVELPFAVAVDSTVPALTSAIAEIDGLPGVRVLLVDDSEMNLEVASRILARVGASVETRVNGQEALERLRAGSNDFDIVLMDVQMPVLDGNQAARKIRTELGLTDLPIIALTAGALLAERQRSLDAGMNDFLSKPFEVRALIRTIQRHAAKALTRAHAPSVDIDTSQVNENDVWPDIDGIDMADVRSRVGDDLSSFERMLRAFSREYRQCNFDYSQRTGAEELGTLKALLHKLRGTAGTLGAKQVEHLAGDVEIRLKRNPDASQLDARSTLLLIELQARLNALIERIGTAISRLSAVRSRDGELNVSLESVEMKQFVQQLRDHDMAALDGFQRLSPGLKTLLGEDGFLSLQTAIDGLEFAVAADLLAQRRQCA